MMGFRHTAAAAALIAIGACGPVDRKPVDRLSASGRLIALSGGGAGADNACIACHGLDGRGDGSGSPRLAGLEFGYLLRQLDSFGDGRRQHHTMGYIAGKLSPEERARVSAFYAAMPYTPPPQPIVPVPQLWTEGDASRGLPACASCHGLLGQGLGPANPAIGGQPAAYLYHQMEQWRAGKRRNDPLNVMLRISQRLTPSEAAALSAYSASLPGHYSSPGSPAASRASRRSGPRNGALPPLSRGAE
jgi:cytochrome c553